MNIKQNLVSSSKYSLKCPNMMTPTYITVHNTANDASAANEIAYMISNTTTTSFHYAVDDKEVIQGIPVNRNAWHCGDGSSATSGNRTSIGIEICYSKSGGERYDKAEALAVKLVAHLLKERGWTIDRVKKHQDWSGKICPHRILGRTNGWQGFLNCVKAELDTLSTSIQEPIVHKIVPIKFNLLGNNKEINGYNINDRSYVQVRPLVEGLNLKIDWDGSTSTVKVIGDGYPIDKITKDEDVTTTVKFNLFDKLNLNIPGYIDNGITYAQVRSLCESMGYIIEWNNNNKTIEITKKLEVQSPIIENNKKYVDIKLLIFGKNVSIPGENINNRSYVRARDLVENMGYGIEWDATNSIVKIVGTGEPLNKITPDKEVSNVKFNLFEKLNLDIPAYIDNGITYVQVRSLCESIGLIVGWNESAQTIEIIQEKEIITYSKVTSTFSNALNIQLKSSPVKSGTSGAWIPALADDISAYLDTKNYNTGNNRYQFLNLAAMVGISLEDMKKFLSGKGILSGKEQVYLDAAKKYGVSEVYLAAHSCLETGNGTSKLAQGIEVNGVKVYNMYGIGAFDSDPNGAGSKRAYDLGWDTPEKAIDGGAKWISEQYINNAKYKQNTLYKMRWNPTTPGTHQYATDIAWAVKQTSNIKKLYDNFPNAKLYFDITQYA